MDDTRKTKAQLIDELTLARQRITELETTLANHVTAELQQLEDKYATLLEKSNDVILVLQDGLLKFANSKAAEITGFSIEDVLGKPFIDYVAPQYRELMISRYRRRLAGEDIPSKYESGLLNQDGSIISVEINASVIEYDGKPATLCMVRDITERKKADEAIRESELNIARWSKPPTTLCC